MAFADDYNTVAERIAQFRAKYPDGSLQPVSLEQPFQVVDIAGRTFIVYAAAAYRTADDTRPGVGLAYEPFPGPTNFTRDSELQNAETSAWGRAIVAVGAADAKKGIATAEDVQNRQAAPEAEHTPAVVYADKDQVKSIKALTKQLSDEDRGKLIEGNLVCGIELLRDRQIVASWEEASAVIDVLTGRVGGHADTPDEPVVVPNGDPF